MANETARPSLQEQMRAAQEKVGWTPTESRPVYTRRWMEIVSTDYLRPDGGIAKDFIRVNPHQRFDYSLVLAHDPTTRELVGIAQYHWGPEEVILKLPAGKTDGKNPQDTAREELLQETGLVGNNFKFLGKIREVPMWHGGTAFLYSAEVDISKMGVQKLEKNENIAVVIAQQSEIDDLIEQSESEAGNAVDGMLAYAYIKAAKMNLF